MRKVEIGGIWINFVTIWHNLSLHFLPHNWPNVAGSISSSFSPFHLSVALSKSVPSPPPPTVLWRDWTNPTPCWWCVDLQALGMSSLFDIWWMSSPASLASGEWAFNPQHYTCVCVYKRPFFTLRWLVVQIMTCTYFRELCIYIHHITVLLQSVPHDAAPGTKTGPWTRLLLHRRRNV